MKKLLTYNESIKKFLIPKTDDQIRKAVYDLPEYKRYAYVNKYNLQNKFSEDEMIEFESVSPYVSEQGRWFNVEFDNNIYSVLIQDNDPSSITVLDENFKQIDYELWDDFEQYIEPYL